MIENFELIEMFIYKWSSLEPDNRNKDMHVHIVPVTKNWPLFVCIRVQSPATDDLIHHKQQKLFSTLQPIT